MELLALLLFCLGFNPFFWVFLMILLMYIMD